MGGEMSALKRLEPLSPSTVVLISFIPTKATAYAACPPPSGEDILTVVRAARSTLPHSRLLFGCMRSKRDRSWEREAVLAGLDGIVLPAEETVRTVQALGWTVRMKNTCCTLG